MADARGLTESAPTAPAAAPMTACRNCGARVEEQFCPRCGQNRDAGVVSLRQMWREFLEDQLSLSSALPRTLGALFLRPGLLTREYAAGRVVHYIRPLRLFLVATVLLFLAVSWRVEPFVERQVAENVVSAPTQAGAGGQVRYDNVNLHTDTAQSAAWLRPLLRRVARRAEYLNTIPPDQLLRAQMTATLEAAGRITFLLVPAFALLMQVLHWWRRRLYAEHFVFGLHFHAAAFLAATLGVLVNRPDVWAAVGLYIGGSLLVALRRVYAQPWWLAALKLMVVLTLYPAAIGIAAGAAALIAFFLI